MPPAGSLPARAPARPPARSRTRAVALAAVAALALAGAGCRRGADTADLPPGAVIAVAGEAQGADAADAADAAVASAPGAGAPRPAVPRTAAPRTAAPHSSPSTTDTAAPTSTSAAPTPANGPVDGSPGDGPEEPPARTGSAATVDVFGPDGLGFVRFGTDAETTVARLRARYGAPDFDSDWATEDGHTFRQLAFGLLTVDLREEGGARTFTGAYYLVPGEGTATAPRFDTDPALGLDGSGAVTFARLTGGAPLTASPDLPGAWCFASATGRLCAYSGEIAVDEHGVSRTPAPNAPVSALVAGRIAFRGHCGL